MASNLAHTHTHTHTHTHAHAHRHAQISDVGAGTVVDAVAINRDSTEFRMSLIYLGSAAFVSALFTALRGMFFTYVTARLKMRCVCVWGGGGGGG
jgi:hypothetical protein